MVSQDYYRAIVYRHGKPLPATETPPHLWAGLPADSCVVAGNTFLILGASGRRTVLALVTQPKARKPKFVIITGEAALALENHVWRTAMQAQKDRIERGAA